MQPEKYYHIGYPPMYFFYNMLEPLFPLFTGFYTVHGPFPLCRARYEEIWEKERDVLTQASMHRFRSNEDVNAYLIREWQKLSGEFVPRNVHKLCGFYNVATSNPGLVSAITKQKSKIICINDATEEVDVTAARKEMTRAFHTILPEKSAFELSSEGEV
jgi:hypothetical protein